MFIPEIHVCEGKAAALKGAGPTMLVGIIWEWAYGTCTIMEVRYGLN